MKPFDIQPSDTEVVIVCAGADMAELFTNAAKAMSQAMGGDSPEGAQRSGDVFQDEVAVKAVDEETLLVDWLTRLQEVALMESIVIDTITVEEIASDSIRAAVTGHRVPEFNHELGEVSLDDVEVKQVGSGYQARIGFVL